MTVKTPILPRARHDNGSSIRLREDNSRLRTDNDHNSHRLREENSRLRTDISRLRIEKAQLRDENSQLRAGNSQLQDELWFTRDELQEEKEISERKDIELARSAALYHILEDEHLRLLNQL